MGWKGWVILISVSVVVISVIGTFWGTFFSLTTTISEKPDALEIAASEGLAVSESRTKFLSEFMNTITLYESITTTNLNEFIKYAKKNSGTIYYFEETGLTLIDHGNEVVYQYWTEEQANNFDNMLNDVLEAEK